MPARIQRCALLCLMVSAAAMPGCTRYDKSDEKSASMTKCLTRLRAIPQLAGFMNLKNEGKPKDDQPLKGVRIALTFSDSLKSYADPKEDVDDECYLENTTENLQKIVDVLKANGIPPTVDFVDGRKVDLKIAELWLKSGNLMGNMSWGHKSAARISADQFVSNIQKTESQLGPLMATYKQKQKFFRFTRLRVSRNSDVRDQDAKWLADNGYLIAPVTIRTYDAKFAPIYCRARSQQDAACANLVSANFFPLLLDSIERARSWAGKLSGQENSSQILELHPNQFTIDNLNDILSRLKLLGAEFIPLDQALTDPIFGMTNKKGVPVAIEVSRRVKTEQRHLAETTQAQAADAN